MIHKFITEVSVRYNPFSYQSKAARLFITFLPSNARQTGMRLSTGLIPRESTEPSSVSIKYKDGKQLKLECDKMAIESLIEEVDRHSRLLRKEEVLSE